MQTNVRINLGDSDCYSIFESGKSSLGESV